MTLPQMITHRQARIASALLLAAVPLFAWSAAAARADMDPASCPMHAQHMAAAKAVAMSSEHDHEHRSDAAMNARGDQGMGFSQATTTHHFLVAAEGGEIRVEAKDPADTTSRDQIRTHLFTIARSFAAGDFEIPMFVHAQTPPGVPVLQRLRDAITYRYADLDHGGRVEIRTANPEALQAIHEFLRFQIQEHQTGDPETPAP